MSVAIITGGGSGIGKNVAIALGKAGYSVVLAGRRQEALDTVVQLIDADGESALGIQTDVSSEDEVKNLFAKTVERFGRVDLLFNNAGSFGSAALLEDLKFEDWKTVLDVNLTGAFMCTQAAFRVMKNQHPMGGRIINNGSISAQVPRPNSAPYTATKHAVMGFTKSVALETIETGITCNAICPGTVRTNMSEHRIEAFAAERGATKEEVLENIIIKNV